MHKLILLIVLTFGVIDCPSLFSKDDSLSFENYVRKVLKYHPLANNAELNLKLSEAQWKSANGQFDPFLKAEYDDKYFDQKQYFQVLRSSIELPSYLGLKFNAGYDNTRGIFLNPENNTPNDGLGYIGVEANLLQGLLIDERRTAVNQAEIFEDFATNRRQIEINDLIIDASIAYYQWQATYEYQLIIEESVELARQYFENNLQSYLFGDKPAVDTLESFLALQDQLIMLQSNSVELVKARNNLNNFTWENDKNITISNDINPKRIELLSSSIISEDTITYVGNPLLEEKRNKINLLLAENDLKSDKLKPKLKVKYNALTSELNNNIPTFNINNYKWGLSFSMPLLFRSERGELEINELKIKETELDLINYETSLKNKQKSNIETLEILKDQLLIVNENVNRYKQLLEFEKEKFDIGESSVFLVNKRQEKYIFSKLKVIDLSIKYNIEVLYNLLLSNQIENYFK
jgi:outer membrane protein TolC